MGLMQCLALIPGVSRSGATISAGLFRGLDRVASTRMSFLIGIPALVGAAVIELPHALEGDVGVVATLVGTVVSFIVAYAAVAWLLRFVQKHTIEVFAIYRVILGVLLIVLLCHRHHVRHLTPLPLVRASRRGGRRCRGRCRAPPSGPAP